MERVGIMAGMGKFDCKGMKELQKELDKLQKETDALMEACAKELAARLLAKVIKRTPVGDYSGDSYVCVTKMAHKGRKVKGKKGGTLRRGWTTQKNGSESLEINHFGNVYVVEIINPVEYASYVEYGHRTIKKDGFGWAPGHFMLKTSEQELRQIAPKVLESKIKKFLGGIMK